MPCPLCEKRKPKRQCPALGQMICPQCCGTYREVTLDCPSSCAYLRESRRYRDETPPAEGEWKPIAPDVPVSELFVETHQPLLLHLSGAITRTCREHGALTDADLLATLESLAQTLATLRSGVIYESLPSGALREALFRALQGAIREYRELERREMAATPVHDGEIETAVVFLARMVQLKRNGRPRSRLCLELLGAPFPAAEAHGSLIVAP